MSLPAYPAYRESGVAWLGQVPAHWEVMPLKRAARLCTDRAADRSFPVGLEHIESWTGRLIEAETEFEGDGVAFRPGDILFGKLRPYLAKAWLADRPGEAVGDFHVIRSLPPHVPEFLQRVLLSREAISLIDGSTYGSKMPRASWEFIGGLAVPLPPPAEQLAIATLLDRECGKIDALVAEQERLIALLKEKRQAVISHAVTKGLDPTAPMKDSGVPWLGQVPAHWEVKRLKYLGDAITGLTYDPSQVVSDPETGTLVLRSSNVQSGRITFDDNVYVAVHVPAELIAKPGDILICSRNGSRALIGKNATITDDAAGATWGAFMTLFRSDHSRYLSCVFNSPLFEAQAGAFLTSTINQLTIEMLNDFAVPLPPPDERDAIATFLDRECGKIDSLITEAGRAIALLKERRAALISAAVTGKIDVRGLVPAEEAAAA